MAVCNYHSSVVLCCQSVVIVSSKSAILKVAFLQSSKGGSYSQDFNNVVELFEFIVDHLKAENPSSKKWKEV